ncbi:OmpW family protein [Acinetobacter chinensis]|uniref:OmpW family protein n=1 Tax=Acinetobacter chinensis TaxID=2004650 RepID=A0A3B7LZ70_9GAMM|nr:OmpW family outer membrane protein [Acinetobacter chinensis]AXY57315.1 OmpW family protein [Acinetobacter chinensis]
MNKTALLCVATGLTTLSGVTQAADLSKYFSMEAKGFKRFSVSAGALLVTPTGKASPIHAGTSISEGYKSKVGDIKASTVIANLDPNRKPNYLVEGLVKVIGIFGGNVSSGLSGDSYVYGLSGWDNPGTGLEADDVLTLGLMNSYYFTDNISFEMKAGIPPKVDIKGKGQINAPFAAVASPMGGLLGNLTLSNSLPITNLEQSDTAATARAWTPAFEFQYHFGKTGVNKFRPYVGAGLMYAYFNELELNKGVEQDLIVAGHMIQNIINNQAGASIEKKDSNGVMKVELEATDAFAPVLTAGFTYDFNDKWYAVASVSYAHLKNESTISVINTNTGVELINSKAEIEVNPIMTYAGIGFRF